MSMTQLTKLELMERKADKIYPFVPGKINHQSEMLTSLGNQGVAQGRIAAARPVETSDDIPTPVWTEPLSFIAGGVIKYRGPMKSGKTRLMIAKTFQFIDTMGYRGEDIFANCWIDIPGAHWLSNDELKKVLKRAFNTEAGNGRWNHKIFNVMEADDLYSHITQSDKKCYEDLQKASQACKRNQYLQYEIHDGLGVPKFLRDKTEISIKPLALDEQEDKLSFLICNGAYEVNLVDWVRPISWVNDKYRRFDELW
jgi:hypothetical protein